MAPKSKGHATAAQASNGNTAEHEGLGNAEAANQAHRGFLIHGGRRRALAKLHERRWRQYADLVATVERVMAAVIAVIRSRRADKLGGLITGTRNKRAPMRATIPYMGNAVSARRIRSGATLHDPQHGRHPRGWRTTLARYLDMLEWAPRDYAASPMGRSWREVLIDLQLSTGERVGHADLLQLDDIRLLRKEGSLSDLIRLFQAEATHQLRVLETSKPSSALVKEGCASRGWAYAQA